MAELQQQDNRNKRGGIRSKKLSTRVDLTPMVDLGFLLITFFIFTTTMQQANGLKLVLPDDTPTNDPPVTADSKTISLILQDNDVIHYYQGLHKEKVQSTNYSVAGLRLVLQQKLKEVRNRFGNSDETVVLIKPTSYASYRNIVAVLDEIKITGVKKYVLMEPSTAENSL